MSSWGQSWMCDCVCMNVCVCVSKIDEYTKTMIKL